MKAQGIIEWIPPLKTLMYKNNPRVLVKMPHGKYETHYYPINEKNELLVHGKSLEDEGSLYNPIVKGKPNFDDDGRYLLRWQYGEAYAFPLDSTTSFEQRVNHDMKIKTAYNIGFVSGRNTVHGQRKSMLDDPVVKMMIGVVLIVAVNLIITYLGLTDLGATIIGGQG